MLSQGWSKTRSSLLNGLFHWSNSGAWRTFDCLYRPAITAFAQRLGLDAADADEAAQETIVRFMSAYRAGKYNPSRGRLRSWLQGIATRRVAELRSRRVRRREQLIGSEPCPVLVDEHANALWDSEWRQATLCQAMSILASETHMDPETLAAFHMLMVHRQSAQQVSISMSIPIERVYLAKHRCLARLRRIVSALDSREDDDSAGDPESPNHHLE